MIYPLGPVGSGASTPSPSLQLKQTLTFDSDTVDLDKNKDGEDSEEIEIEPLLKGVINDIAVFERRPEQTKPGQTLKKYKSKSGDKSSGPEPRGLCIVAALGKEHRFGRWKCFKNNNHDGPTSEGRNGAVVFEVSFVEGASVESADDVNGIA
jgi:ribosomal RNA-processing protein 9